MSTERTYVPQVGGAHYQSSFQHWDLAAEARMGWLEYQITRYVGRHHRKAGLQDLEKALSFADKGIALSSYGAIQPQHLFPVKERVDEYCAANGIRPHERNITLAMLRWRGLNDLMYVRSLIAELILLRYPLKAPARLEDTPLETSEREAVEPGPGYVNQDGPEYDPTI